MKRTTQLAATAALVALAAWAVLMIQNEPVTHRNGADSPAATNERPEHQERRFSSAVDLEESDVSAETSRQFERAAGSGFEEPTSISSSPERFAEVSEATREWIEANYVLPRSLDRTLPCHPLSVATGRVICWEQFDYHPMLQYTVEELELIADTSAEASAVLSLLLLDTDKDASLVHAFHATELTGKMGPLHTYIVSVDYDQESVDDLLELYALARHIEFSGWDRPLAYSFAHFLRVKGLSTDEIHASIEDPLDLRDRARRAEGGAE